MLALVVYFAGPVQEVQEPLLDQRDIRNGSVLPDEGYCDQPYVVHTSDGAWLCVMTTGPEQEGAGGQHVISIRSTDHGQTWSDSVDIEPSDGPVASWGMPFVTPFGRVYVFYSYNGEEISGRRADMLGWYCFRYSDDDGRTWSGRQRIPLRVTAADRGNDWQGKVQIFWGIGKPITLDHGMIFGFTKIGRYMLDESEGWFVRSSNIMGERDVSKIQWELLPEGDHGLRAPAHGSIQSEQNLVVMDNGDLYCMYRTTMGYPCHSYSRDGGRTWSLPEAATYSPGGVRIKHPRACPRLWRTNSGQFLFWFHNNGEKDWSPGTRNPCWIVAGEERGGFMYWSQPEILLYDQDASVRISYPDLIEEDGRYWVTETQKSIARVHEIDPLLIEGMTKQGKVDEVPQRGLVLAARADEIQASRPQLPALPDLALGGGFTLELWLTFPHEDGGSSSTEVGPEIPILQAIGDNKGLSLSCKEGAVSLTASLDGEAKTWSCDPGLLEAGKRHHVVVIADGGPGILMWVVNGVLCDGRDDRVRGWQRLRTKPGESTLLGQAARSSEGRPLTLWASQEFQHLRVYSRALRTSEAIASYHAGKE